MKCARTLACCALCLVWVASVAHAGPQAGSPQPAGAQDVEPDASDDPEDPEAVSDAEVQACLDTGERAQDLRDKAELIAARAAFIECAQERCPKVVRDDCQRWAHEVEEITPSIVPAARDKRGRDLVVVNFSIDGELTKKRLDGKAIPLDPGPHQFRWENWDGVVKEARYVIRQGEKSRAISVVLAPRERHKSVKPRPEPEYTVPAASWILGGIGLAGIAVFAGLAASAKSDYDTLLDDCAPSCTDDDVDPVRNKLIGADVALGAGILSLGIAAVLAFTLTPDPEPEPGAARVELIVGPTGANLAVSY